MKRISALIMCVTIGITLILSGCQPAATSAPTAAQTQPSAGGPPQAVFPLKDKVTFSTLYVQTIEVPDVQTNAYFAWYEQKTNVHLEFNEVPGDAAADKIALLISSGDYPEIFLACNISKEDEVKYAKEGVFLPLGSLIEKYGAEFNKAVALHPDVMKQITTPDGNIYSLPSIQIYYHSLYSQKAWINQKWLTELGLQMPKTTDDLVKVLKAFKTQDPNGNGKADEIPLMGSTDGWHTGPYFLFNPFIYHSGNDFFYINGQGDVDLNANKPEYKQALAYIRQLVADGLYDPTSLSQKNDQLKQIGDNPDVEILGMAFWGTPEGFITRPSDRFADYEAVPPLTGPNGVKQAPYYVDFAITGEFLVTDKCKNPDLAVQWVDGLYGEEATLRTLGVEGSDWRKGNPDEVDFNGDPASYVRILTDENMNNQLNTAMYAPVPQNLSDQFLAKFSADPDPAGRSTQAGLEYWLYKATKDFYEPAVPAKTYNVAYLDTNVIGEAATLKTTIDTYIWESTARFIIGDLNLDADWDKYVQDLKDMGVDRYIQIYNEAYQRENK